MTLCLYAVLVKKKEQKVSRRLGILTEKETQFLFLSEDKQKMKYKEGTRKYFQRIVNSANQGFQDYSIMINKLPKRYRSQINFLSGLRDIEKSLSKVKDTDQIPHRILETTVTNLEESLKIIGKQYNSQLENIAEPDFESVKDWILMAQKYPKSPDGL